LATAVLLSPEILAEGDARHFPDIFVGVLDTEHGDKTLLGLEYEYKFSPRWGAGIVYDDAEKTHGRRRGL
jgi:hypothetical protein